MKKFESLGKTLSKKEQKTIVGGFGDGGGGGGGQNCSTICYNCVALSMYCSGDCTPNDHGIWCNGNYYTCPTGNYCS